MQPRKTWPSIVLTSALIGLPVLVLGWATSQFWPTVAFLLGAALAWNVYNLLSLEAWLRRGGRSEPPEVGGLWGMTFDLLERRRRRHERRVHRLRQLLERYRDSAKAMPDAVVILNHDQRIEWMNDMAAALLGLAWPTDENNRVTHLIRHPDFIAFMGQAHAHPEALTLPSPMDAERRLEIRLVPYGDVQYLLLARDTTHLYRLEIMRRDFIANVSHELRTPLTVLYGVAETLEDELADQPDLLHSVQMLRGQSERMKLLVDDLLTLSRLETGTQKGPQSWVDVPSLLASLQNDAQALSSDRHHDIQLEADPGLQLFGCEQELRSAFANLVFNAVKYTSPGTRIEITWQQDADGARLQVRDHGPGIASHHLARLTERFYRVDNGRSQGQGGTGLGLAIVKHVLARHDAHLRIQSRIGEGSTFTCLFPDRLTRRQSTGLPEEIAGTP